MSKPKNFCFRIVLLLILSSFALSGCGSSSKRDSGPSNGGQTGQGSLKVKFALPHYPGIDFSERFTSKAIDPQTYKIRIKTREFYEDALEELITVDLSSGTITESQGTKYWEATFDMAPYNYDTILVELLDNNGIPLTAGKVRFVTVSRDNTTEIAIGCLPVNHTVIPTNGTPIVGSVTSGKMKYYSFHAIYGGTYNISLTPSSGNPYLYLFEPNGALKNGAGEGSYTAAMTGTHYLGVYSPDATTFQVSVNTTYLPPPELDHLIINEINNYNGNSVIEIYNPTNTSMNLLNWKIVIDNCYYSENVTINTDFIIPARSFAIVGQDHGFGWGTSTEYNLSDSMFCHTSPSWWSLSNDVGIALEDSSGSIIDFVWLNSGTVTIPPGMWNSVSGVVWNTGTVARKYAPPFDTNTVNDWERSYGTIGLPNSASGEETIFIDIE